jgi:formylglycine-generating enzyme required for sulfatase activity
MCLFCFSAIQPNKRDYIPPGFALIQNPELAQPLLIQENPVTNQEYQLYQLWQKYMFPEYPECYRGTFPGFRDSGWNYNFNDPYNQRYTSHPAYALYPVTGVNWQQAMEYCAWRTDRLNEAICIQIGGLQMEKEFQYCTEENTFNTEAFLNGQFEFAKHINKHKAYFHLAGKSYRNRQDSLYTQRWRKSNNVELFPSLLYGGRLPTEEEWEYYMSESKQVKSTEIEEGIQAEFLWKQFHKKEAEIKWEKGFSNNEMRTNMDEWMLDNYSPKKKKYSNYEDIFTQNGMKIILNLNLLTDDKGYLIDKDSTGKFGFRFMGYSDSYKPITVLKYGYQRVSYRIVEWVDMPMYLRRKAVEKYMWEFGSKGRPVWSYGIPSTLGEEQEFYFRDDKRVYYTNFKGGFQSVYADTVYLGRQAIFKYTAEKGRLGFDISTKQNRVVKGSGRKEIDQFSGNSEIGFRMVIPWYGKRIPEKIGW